MTVMFPAVTCSVEARHLSVTYGKGDTANHVVRDVSFSIAPGEAYGMIGESGSGKSTIAFALMQYLGGASIEADKVVLNGTDLLTGDASTLKTLRGKRIGMVYQDPMNALNPMLRVGEQVAETLRRHMGMSAGAARARVIDLFGKVRLPDPASIVDRYPHQLSGGQQQRVVIAMAISCEPELVIMDEPTTGLDVTTEAVVLDLIRDLRQDVGSSILFISHNLGVVSKVCDRIGVLYAGELVEEGRTSEILRSPRHPYTMALIDAIPSIAGPKKQLRSIPGFLPDLHTPPTGCIFAPRCWMADDVCRTNIPPDVPQAGAGKAKCFKSADVASARDEAEAPVADSNAPAPIRLEVVSANKIYHADKLARLLKGTRDVVAVDNISLSVAKGATLALVGESGSGKSTLGRCIAGLTLANGGNFSMDGTSLHPDVGRRTKPQHQAIQFIFQNPDTSLNPRQTIGTILSRPIELYLGLSKEKTDQRIEELLDLVKLGRNYKNRYPAQLSGGQKQRVAIARAFAAEPELIICDEPTSALDISVQAAILNQLRDLQRRFQTSFIFISHDLGVVRYIADEVMVMQGGKVVEAGMVDEVLEKPQHPYTRQLLDAVPRI